MLIIRHTYIKGFCFIIPNFMPFPHVPDYTLELHDVIICADQCCFHEFVTVTLRVSNGDIAIHLS